jgi:hypothetical protein
MVEVRKLCTPNSYAGIGKKKMQAHRAMASRFAMAAAVISQVIQDAITEVGTKKKSATTWLLQDQEGFPFWCNVLGVDPNQTRQEPSDRLAP